MVRNQYFRRRTKNQRFLHSSFFILHSPNFAQNTDLFPSFGTWWDQNQRTQRTQRTPRTRRKPVWWAWHGDFGEFSGHSTWSGIRWWQPAPELTGTDMWARWCYFGQNWGHSQFFILHSSFFILHSQFFILNSSFFILHSSFSILHSQFFILNSSFSNPVWQFWQK